MSCECKGCRATREKLPGERWGMTRHFTISTEQGGEVVPVDVYFTANLYADGRVGEVFVHVGKEGELAHGALDAAVINLSIALQHGVPLAQMTSKMRATTFEPNGFTGDAAYPKCTSVLDLLARWLDDLEAANRGEAAVA